jgi:7 transmembrane receptor (Secretin family)
VCVDVVCCSLFFYSISLSLLITIMALLPSTPYSRIVIEVVSLLFHRSLRCTRITIHINLFVSFAVNNALWILWYRLVVERTTVLTDNEVSALLLTLLSPSCQDASHTQLH